VKAQYGKRLIILVTELDTGRERQLTPESDGELPVRVAVRMSMGIPGLVEPFRCVT
jgi:predicted acylesterase/phospholipase RssA